MSKKIHICNGHRNSLYIYYSLNFVAITKFAKIFHSFHRNQAYSCYGHHSEVNETFFQLEGPIRLTSGLPVSKDPNYMLDNVAKTKLAKDRHISLM